MGGQSESRSAPAVLVENAGRFYLYQPGLGVISSGDNVASAYDGFVAARAQYLSEVRNAGLTLGALETTQQVGTVVARSDFVREIGLFATKTAIVLGIIGVFIAVIGQVVGGAIDRVSEAASRMEPLSINDAVDKAAAIVHDFRLLPEERKEALRKNIGTISREVAPLVEAWRNPGDAEPAKAR